MGPRLLLFQTCAKVAYPQTKKVEGHHNFVPIGNVCKRQKEVWLTPQSIYILNQHSQSSRCSYVRRSVWTSTYITETILSRATIWQYCTQTKFRIRIWPCLFLPPSIDKNWISSVDSMQNSSFLANTKANNTWMSSANLIAIE